MNDSKTDDKATLKGEIIGRDHDGNYLIRIEGDEGDRDMIFTLEKRTKGGKQDE